MLEICSDSSYFGQTAQPLGRFTPAITEIDLPVCRRFGEQKAALDVPAARLCLCLCPGQGCSWLSFATDTGGNEQHQL